MNDSVKLPIAARTSETATAIARSLHVSEREYM